ncbi:dTMP kinase [soil metagenome]
MPAVPRSAQAGRGIGLSAVGTLVALEGLDGAVNRTSIGKVETELRRGGTSIATLDFPRYGKSIHADLAAEALKGSHGDLAESVNAMAVLFALDRAGAADRISELLSTNDIVLLDRYVASNAAYNAARVHQGVDGEMVAWIRELELGRLALPAPDLQLYLDVPVALAEQRARSREAQDASRQLDAYERDGGLQARTGELYKQLAATNWASPWWIVGPETDPADLARRLADFA